MAPTAFADTFYWIALIDPTDTGFAQARRYSQGILTTDEVLTEFLNAFSRTPAHTRQLARRVAQRILDEPEIIVVPQSRASFLAGLELYESRTDKGYSLTDCISMATMRQFRLTQVLTNDRHFEHEGFEILLKQP